MVKTYLIESNIIKLCKSCGKISKIGEELVNPNSIPNPELQANFCKCKHIRCSSCDSKLKVIITPVANIVRMHKEKIVEYTKGYDKFDGYFCNNHRCEMFKKKVK